MIRSSRSTGLVLVVLAACLMMTLTAACGGGSSGGGATAASPGSPYAGTWNLDGAGMTLDADYSGYSIGSPGEGGSVTVSDDGKKVTMTGSNDVTWEMVGPRVDGEYLIFTAGSESDADTWAIRLSGGRATLTKWDEWEKAWGDGFALVKAQ